MKTVKNGGTLWGSELAKIVREQFPDLISPNYYEIGAFDGQDARVFKEWFPMSKLYLFEASPETFLRHLNDYPFGQAFPLAIGNKNDFIYLYERDDSQLNGLYEREDRKEKPTRFVECVRLEDVVKNLELPKPSVVKIDTEGGTYEVLEGMGDLVYSTLLFYIETEEKDYFPTQKKHKDVEKFLKERGFECILLHKNDGQNDSIWIRSLI